MSRNDVRRATEGMDPSMIPEKRNTHQQLAALESICGTLHRNITSLHHILRGEHEVAFAKGENTKPEGPTIRSLNEELGYAFDSLKNANSQLLEISQILTLSLGTTRILD